MKKSAATAFAILVLAGATSVSAAIVVGNVTGGSIASANPAGAFVKLDPSAGGFSVGQNNFNTNTIYGFDEQQGFTLTAELAANLGLTSIAAGTRVNSHFLFFDPLLTQTAQATVVFDTPVLAAITLRPQLMASNFLGASRVTYLTPSSVGLESGIDFLRLGAPDANSIRITNLNADSPGDHFRILTLAPALAVPEPATWLQMLVGFGLLGSVLRGRARKVTATA